MSKFSTIQASVELKDTLDTLFKDIIGPKSYEDKIWHLIRHFNLSKKQEKDIIQKMKEFLEGKEETPEANDTEQKYNQSLHLH